MRGLFGVYRLLAGFSGFFGWGEEARSLWRWNSSYAIFLPRLRIHNATVAMHGSSQGVEDDSLQALHAFALAGIVPHSGQRSGVARRS